MERVKRSSAGDLPQIHGKGGSHRVQLDDVRARPVGVARQDVLAGAAVRLVDVKPQEGAAVDVQASGVSVLGDDIRAFEAGTASCAVRALAQYRLPGEPSLRQYLGQARGGGVAARVGPWACRGP